MIETALRQLLIDDADVASRVGTRVYPMQAPQGVKGSHLVYERISGPRDHTMDGASGLASPRFQIFCRGADGGYASAKSLADAVRRALDGYRGTADGQTIYSIFLEDDQDVFDEDPAGGDAGICSVALDFIVHHKE